LQLEWAKSDVGVPGEVVALASAGDAVWAVARQRPDWWRRLAERLNVKTSGIGTGVVSHVLSRHDGRWSSRFSVRGSLNAICTMGDGSVVAVGDRLAVHCAGGQWAVFRPPVQLNHVWGARSSCVYALGQDMLFYFGGGSWTHVDLPALGINGQWADGSCDSSGASWIVGTWGTHSCMAKGLGTEWKSDGCGSWYLYKVAIGENGHGFAAGGDGLWQRVDDSWEGVEAYGRDLLRVPLALLACSASPLVVSWRAPGPSGEGAGKIRPCLNLDVFVSCRWQTVSVPVPQTSLLQSSLRLALRPIGTLLVAAGEAVWESSLLIPLLKLPSLESLPTEAASLAEIGKFISTFDPTEYFRERWQEDYVSNISSLHRRCIESYRAGLAATEPADELLMCVTYDFILGPYLGVPEPHKLPFLLWLVNGIRQQLSSGMP
jgi:hypothetical protein